MICLGFSAACQVSAGSTDPAVVVSELNELSFEEFANLTITSVSKRAQPQWSAAAAVTVVTAEDIRRSGAQTIPDVLRLVPGVQVYHLDSGGYSVSMRGFSRRAANKLLILQDGRSLYDPFVSGTFWEARDFPLAQIERIEVIRGPGGTLWGSNAVNGIVNIITRSAGDTSGLQVEAAAGNERRYELLTQWSGEIAPQTDARVYVHGHDQDESHLPGGVDDDGQAVRTGFRLDATRGENGYQLQGDYFNRWSNGTSTTPALFPFGEVRFKSASLMFRWEQAAGDTSQSVNAFIEYFKFDHIASMELHEHIADVEYQRGQSLGDADRLTWGAGFRFIADHGRNRNPAGLFNLVPRQQEARTWNAFAQNDHDFLDDRMTLTTGVKFEHNSYTGSEWQPNVRLAWKPDHARTGWLAWSRAVRVPTRFDGDLSILPNKQLEAEVLVAFEAGWRQRLTETATLDLSLYRNEYDELIVPDAGTPQNAQQGKTQGYEVDLRWRVIPAWELRAAYTNLQIDLEAQNGATGLTAGGAVLADIVERDDPRHRWNIQSYLDVAENWELNSVVRYAGDIEGSGHVDSYLELDSSVHWRPRKDWEVALIGRNLLDSNHPEAPPQQITSQVTEVQRSFLVRLRWNF